MKQFFNSAKKKIIVISIALFAVISFGFVDSYFEISKNLEVISTILRELNAYYVDDIKPGELMKKGIDGMLESLDPYTEFYPESEIEDYKVLLTGQYGGIGALIHKNGDYCVVSEPYEGFPAQKNGMLAGDILLEVNGTSVVKKNTSDVSKLLKGQAGTPVKILLKREGVADPIEMTFNREEIKIKNVPYYGMISDSVGYIKLTGFTDHASKEVRDAFVSLKEKYNLKALVFDLRGNGGGLLREAVDIVNLFVERGQIIVSQKGKIKEMNKVHYAEKQPLDTKIPMVVLVDKGSASASEIVSGSLQDLDRAVIIGQRSFGKGLVQQTLQLVYNTQMKVTIAKYYTSSGRCIQALDYFHKNPDGTVDKVADSLMKEFKTKNNRLVYDGGGIYPDIVIPSKTYSNITLELSSKYLLFDYATVFKNKNQTITEAKKFMLSDTDYESFLSFLNNKEYDYSTKSEAQLEKLKETAVKEKYFSEIESMYDEMKSKLSGNKNLDLKKFKEEIKVILENEIVSRYYFQTGRVENSFKSDEELIKAIEVLTNPKLVSDILTGEGDYKIIGKPSVVKKKSEESVKNNSEEDKKGSNKKDSKKPVKKG